MLIWTFRVVYGMIWTIFLLRNDFGKQEEGKHIETVAALIQAKQKGKVVL
jgi:hypothetical protein